MTIQSYSDLLAAIGNYAIRGDTATLAPEYIALAEGMIRRRMRIRRSLTVNSAFSITGEFTAAPGDFAAPEKLRLTSVSPFSEVDWITDDAMDRMMEDYSEAGQPLYYTISGTNIRVLPAPDATYTAELSYWADLPALSNSQTTNWVLTRAPDVYLYGSLIHLGIRTSDERLQAWETAFTTAIDELVVTELNSQQGVALIPAIPAAP